MNTDTMNVALSEEMKSFVTNEVEEGGYSSVSEYVRDLIRAKKKEKEQHQPELLLLEGLNSGKATEMTKGDWEKLRSHVLSKKAK